MRFEGHKVAFVTIIISFGLFLLSWKPLFASKHRYIIPKHELLIGDLALQSRFENITISILTGLVLPIIIILSAKVYLFKKSKKKDNK